MQSKKSKQINFKEEKELKIYSIDGKIISIKKFLTDNLDLLSDIERELVEKEIDNIKEEKILMNTPLSRTKKFFNGKKIIFALRGGTRSAYEKRLFLH